MSASQFTGFGDTLEEALTAAATAALKEWKPKGPDDMATLSVDSTSVLYGGIAGHVGTRVVTVSLPLAAASLAAGAVKAAPKAQLSLKLEVIPDVIYANLMPPVRRPQPHKVGLLFTVTNTGTADYIGQSPDTAVARFSILRGRTTIWEWPQFAGQVITNVTIKPGDSRSFTASWEMADALEFLHADLHAVARFVPSGDSAMREIQIKPVF
jgi:hypothetical protein